MSIKKLFNKGRQGSRNYADYADEKTTFEDVESSRNSQQISIEKTTYKPQVDYSEPRNFVRFGSAEIYYSGAMNRIADYYPYDGSDAEKNEFYNNLFEAEKYIFNNLYPRFNGHAILGADGISFDSKSSDGYGSPSAGSEEYIAFTGGPNSGSGGTLQSMSPNPYNNKYQGSNIYDTQIYETAGLPTDYGKGTRESNLKSNFDTGVTVEFWLKKNAFVTSDTEREIILDISNNELTSSDSYGRITIELDGDSPSRPFNVTVQSGTISASFFQQPIGQEVTTDSLEDWAHYAFRFYNTGSQFIAKLHVNGQLNDTITGNEMGEITTKAMLGRIGALVTAPSGSSAAAGDGTLSASIDDFRFWKSDRDSRQIALNYFVNVGGGSNSDISNTALGVYYKFNEGITTDSATDSIVLDYAGRVTNGLWTGYDAASRNTDSAIVLAGAAAVEYKEPVVRKNHSDYINLKDGLNATGSFYDANNNAAFMNYMPSWVLDEHDDTENTNLKIISHMAGMYFDKMYMLASELPKFKHLNYTTASSSPVPFASHLPTSMGLYVPELFVDATILERLLDRTEKELFESKLHEVKNLIYLNLYNNLTNIYKSKGTEKAIRNVFRCFNIDDNLIKLNTFNKNATYELKTNLKQEVVEKNTIQFNEASNIGAVVYQKYDSTNPESQGFLTSLYPAEYAGATIEADIMFPRFFLGKDKFDRSFKEVSLFGVAGVDSGSNPSMLGDDTTTLASDVANFQVYAVRDSKYSPNVHFKLKSETTPIPFPELTSSTFFDVYDNNHWNLSVRIKPKDFPNAGMVSGSLTNEYDVIFRGVNNQLGTILNSFEVTGTMSNASGSLFLRSPKRLYVGARRQNLTGAVLQYNDTQTLGARYWTKYIDNHSLNMHAYGDENVGVTDSYRSHTPIDKGLIISATTGSAAELTNNNTLALSWTFNNVTASNAAGNFTVDDYSSGSALIRDNYSWLGAIAGYQHDGYGYGFANSSTNVVSTERINAFNFVDPEQAVASEMINIRSDDDEVLDIVETIPNYVFTLEKSMYQSVSSEMVNFFAGAVDFNNVIGDPVNRYRSRYKSLEKLRQSFYERVTTVSDVEKYIDYYKWFDDALSTIVSQLVPASADFTNDVMNMVESHVLERNKYETKFPTLETRAPSPEGAAYGYYFKKYPYRVGFSPPPKSPRDTTVNAFYWKNRAERSAEEITSGDATIDAQRDTYKRIINTNPFLSQSLSNLFNTSTSTTYNVDTYARRNFIKTFDDNITKTKVIKGGTNFEENKNIHFVYSSLHPAGQINTEDGKIVPLNVLLSFMEDLVKVQTNNDPKLVTEKIKRYTKVLSGREFEDGLGYKNMKSSMAFPFNIISGTISTGYQKEVSERLSASVIITNLHNDVYGPDMEVPMQGPFTNYAVGGHQSRHVKLNEGSDDWLSRPEAWKIQLGTCEDIPSGAIGMTGPDYPNPGNYLTPKPYPDTRPLRAVYYRDHVAKRPVNIRNIRMTTGSTILGNYRETYQYVQAPGAFNNPRNFVDNQPDLPSQMFINNTTSSMIARTFLDMHRDNSGHTQNVDEYSIGYLTGASNKSVIISRFSHLGGIEVSTRGYQDIRASEFSAYNCFNNRNLTVRKPWQGPSGSISQPIINGDTTNIQVFDIHGLDYGLYSHLARHTARFGRDSLHTPFDQTGATYDELPGMHKVHRNNIESKTLNYAYRRVLDESAERLINTASLYWEKSNLAGVEDNVFMLGALHAEDARRERIFDAEYAHEFSNGQSVLYSLSAWMKFPGTTDTPAGRPGVYQAIFDMGWTYDGTNTPGNPRPLQRLTIHPNDRRANYYLSTLNPAVSAQKNTRQFLQSTNTLPVIADNEWHHFVFTFSGSHGSLSNQGISASLWVDGVETVIANGAPADYDYFHTSSNFTNFRQGTNLFLKPVTYFGVINSTGSAAPLVPYQFSGFADEIALYKKQLTSAEVSTIYNGGAPCNLTSSAAAATGSLLSWFRCGDLPSDNTSQSGSLATMNSNTARITEIPGSTVAEALEFAYLTAKDGEILKVGISSVNFLTGCATYLTEEYISGYTDRPIYDNFNVQHQIPRSSKQYAWITASLETDNGWVGFTPVDFYVKKSRLGISGPEEYVNTYEFVSASEAASGIPSGVTRRFPSTTANQRISQVEYLNLNIHEPIDSSTNTIGYSADIPLTDTTETNTQYMNTDLIDVVGTPISAQGPAFNNLMFKRGSQYGFPSWKQLRQANNPVLRNQRKTNIFSAVSNTDDNSIDTYRLPPVSNRAKPDMVNFYMGADRSTYTFLATGENERIYFNDKEADDRYAPEFDTFMTPADQMMVFAAEAPETFINWVVNSQQLFPSIRNEFVSTSYDKPGYDNLYWRDNRSERNSVNTVFNRFGALTASDSGHDTTNGLSTENSFGIYVSQSAWPLDAPVDFLTRHTVYQQQGEIFGVTQDYKGYVSAKFTSGAAGELQNLYMGFTTGSINGTYIYLNGNMSYLPTGQLVASTQNGIGSLYARKHALDGAPTVKSPYGPSLPYTNLTGALTAAIVSSSFCRTGSEKGIAIDMGAGEALWEAPSQAGYIQTIPTVDENGVHGTEKEFVSASSEPWYNQYADYRHHLKLKAKGFSVVPEFRISEHLNEYLEDDNSLNRFTDLNLEIPHVNGATSKQDENFYITYSNSEFLRDFLKVRHTAVLKASQIKVTCTGAIKLNPYKGFYPAQRTIQLAESFKDSYLNNLAVSYGEGTDNIIPPGNRIYTGDLTSTDGTGPQVLSPNTGAVGEHTINNLCFSYGLRPLVNTMFSPGILYNSVKSGLAVDYPITTSKSKIVYIDHSSQGDHDQAASGSWAVNLDKNSNGPRGAAISAGDKYTIFDERLPFETMIEPEKYLQGKPFFDMEANPFYGTRILTASFVQNQSKQNYNLMARNFFGSVPSFFLQNGELTSIKSALYEGTKTFKSGAVFMMRVKVDRSTSGPRTYLNEFDANYAGNEDPDGNSMSLFGKYGGIPIDSMTAADSTGTSPTFQTSSVRGALGFGPGGVRESFYPLPQDPIYNPEFKETFTMYSRPSAFGPDMSGRPHVVGIADGPYSNRWSGSLDSFVGINPGYTPPYYNGEAWCDLIFRPDPETSYTLEKIMEETEAVYWRFDAGPRISSSNNVYDTGGITRGLIPDTITNHLGLQEYGSYAYGGASINDVSMQISASFNLFGIEKESFIEVDKFGNVDASRPGTKIGTRWVIRSKFETPMLNFSDTGIHPISGANITFPENYGGASTPRGMWHQFGVIPSGSTGVHLTVQDVPKEWLNNHYLAKDFKSIYNNDDPKNNLAAEVQSLADLVGFRNDRTKLGVIKEKQVIREAVVAIPYIVEKVDNQVGETLDQSSQYKKSFIAIPPQRFAAALEDQYGSVTGDTMFAAGPSISKQIQKMKRYIFPPQLDFVSNPDAAVDPFVMYIFEFKYEFDKDDLSYIWQNLAPRDYKKLSFQTESVAHELINTELLSEETLLENQHLRWMIFKVKQKGQEDYWNYTDEQIGSNNANSYERGIASVQNMNKNNLSYNWPYDYISFVEMIKVDCDLLFSGKPQSGPDGNIQQFYHPGGGSGQGWGGFFTNSGWGGWKPPPGSTTSPYGDSPYGADGASPGGAETETTGSVTEKEGEGGRTGGGGDSGGGGSSGPGITFTPGTVGGGDFGPYDPGPSIPRGSDTIPSLPKGYGGTITISFSKAAEGEDVKPYKTRTSAPITKKRKK